MCAWQTKGEKNVGRSPVVAGIGRTKHVAGGTCFAIGGMRLGHAEFAVFVTVKQR